MRRWRRADSRRPAAPTGPAGTGASAPLDALAAGPALPQADVVLLTRVGCHLCELAHDVVGPVTERHGVSLVELDVEADPQLRSRYTDHVPVLFVHGRLLDYWQVREDRLEDALQGRPVSPPAPL